MKTSLSFLLFLSFSLGQLFGQTPLLRVHDIQGEGNSSPFLGQIVQLDTAVVTFANSSFAYVQDAIGDDNPATSEGLLIDDGNTFQLVPGDRVRIIGRVEEVGRQTALGSSVTITKISSGAPLEPEAFFPGTSAVNGTSPLERYEGMLLDFSVIASSGTDNFGTADVYSSTLDRPFREPGVLTPGLPNLPVFDGNPELMNYDPNGLGQSNFSFHNAGDEIEGVGILEHFSFGYELSPIAPTEVTLAPSSTAVRQRNTDELTVGSINTLFFREEEDDYALRLTKLVNYIGTSLEFPDVLAIQEIGGSDELEDLIFRLRQLDPQRGDYQGFSPPNGNFLNLGFLVHQRIEAPTFTELGVNEFCSCGGFLHNRPPLLAEMAVPGDEATTLRVLNLHIRSLNGIDDDIEVRQRRNEQAISIANMVEDLRDENLVIVGDYNAFQFSDGYVDVFNQISGKPSLGAQFEVEDIVDPPLENAADLLPEGQRYSFVFRGSAQQIDHCLHNELSGLTANDLEFARGNADAAITYASNALALPRASDHDGFVFYLGIDALSSVASSSIDNTPILEFANPAKAGTTIAYSNIPKNGVVTITDILGRQQLLLDLRNQSPVTANGYFALPAHLLPGIYWLTTSVNSQVLSSQSILIKR